MNEISSFHKKNEELKKVLNEMKKLYVNSSDIKKLIVLYNKNNKLRREIKEIKPIYLKERMRECNHLFIRTAYKHFDDKESNKYILFVNHYCLKCGCSTKKLEREYFNISLPSFYVSHNDQIEIIENAVNYEVIDFKESDLFNLIINWEELKMKNKTLSFKELVDLFIKENEAKTTSKGEKLYEFKYLD